MKKKIFCILFAVLLCAALCGCGSYRTDDGTRNGDMDILPDVSPMATPDAQDGEVTDQDGIIGNGHGADNGQTGSTVSPSPSSDPNTAMPGTSPTTAPSASPKP